MTNKGALRVYIGTNTGAKSQGIYLAWFDPATGQLSEPELAARIDNPIFLSLHPNRPCLYAVSSLGIEQAGAVVTFAIDPTGKLSLLNRQSCGGKAPCYLAVDPTGNCALVANYASGSIAALPIRADGRLGEPSALVQHKGSSLHPRQNGPHAHFIIPDPDGRFALACDLGVDKVFVYRLDPARGTLEPNDPPSVSVNPGSGPRHLAFHPDGKQVYLINEIASTLTVLAYDPEGGVLKGIQTLSTLPEDFAGANTSAEVQVDPSGRFVYGSNRGHNSIAVFSIEAKSGRLRLVEHQSTQGKNPRFFTLDPSGRFLLAENQGSDSIVVFRVNTRTGRLTPAGRTVKVGSPVCALFVP